MALFNENLTWLHFETLWQKLGYFLFQHLGHTGAHPLEETVSGGGWAWNECESESGRVLTTTTTTTMTTYIHRCYITMQAADS